MYLGLLVGGGQLPVPEGQLRTYKIIDSLSKEGL